MRKKLARAFLVGWKGWSQVRRQLIMTQWGFVSECKHSPTCSEYMAQQIEEHGWRGIAAGCKRLWSCR